MRLPHDQWRRRAALTLLGVVGLIGVPAAVLALQGPGTGFVEICKAAEGPTVSGVFRFSVDSHSVDVPVGACSPLISVPVGTLTIIEAERPGISVAGVQTTPISRLVSSDAASRTARVQIVAGDESTQTTVTFTNRSELAILKICKVAGPGVAVGTNVAFTAGTVAVTVPAGPPPGGTCVVTGWFPVATNVAVTESIPDGTEVSAITVAPADRLVGSPNLPGGSVVVRIGSGAVEATFTNRVPPPPVAGTSTTVGTTATTSTTQPAPVTTTPSGATSTTLPGGPTSTTTTPGVTTTAPTGGSLTTTVAGSGTTTTAPGLGATTTTTGGGAGTTTTVPGLGATTTTLGGGGGVSTTTTLGGGGGVSTTTTLGGGGGVTTSTIGAGGATTTIGPGGTTTKTTPGPTFAATTTLAGGTTPAPTTTTIPCVAVTSTSTPAGASATSTTTTVGGGGPATTTTTTMGGGPATTTTTALGGGSPATATTTTTALGGGGPAATTTTPPSGGPSVTTSSTVAPASVPPTVMARECVPGTFGSPPGAVVVRSPGGSPPAAPSGVLATTGKRIGPLVMLGCLALALGGLLVQADPPTMWAAVGLQLAGTVGRHPARRRPSPARPAHPTPPPAPGENPVPSGGEADRADGDPFPALTFVPVVVDDPAENVLPMRVWEMVVLPDAGAGRREPPQPPPA